MKKLTLITMAVILTATISCSDDETTTIEQTETLTQQEIDDLKFSREEEKLARDVYLFSYDKYGQDIFNNISKSEQQHMDKILVLLNTYQLSDPASVERGVFSNQTLQGLYDDLTAQSDISLIEALKVGAIIEDLDINDLDLLESRTTRNDILNAYDKLKCGSRNHLRNYISQLVLNEVSYVPQFISLDDFTEIINSDNEQCGR
jgi:hypothetical protein